METGSIKRPTWHPPRPRSGPGQSGQLWPVAAGLLLAGLCGYVAGGGELGLAIALALGLGFALIALTAPEKSALALIVLLPFAFYPATAGGFSLFAAVPAFGFVSLVLLSRSRISVVLLRPSLPVLSFIVLLLAAITATTLSADPLTASTRLVYLLLFGLFAMALASALADGRLSRRTVAAALLAAGSLASAALAIQFAIQFAIGDARLLDWLFDVRALFAGERSAEVQKSNWVVENLNVVRGVFPFMAPSSAGQFLMFSLIAGVWLRREGDASTRRSRRSLETFLVALVAIGLLLTLSRQSWLGALAGILLLSFGRRPAYLLAAIPVLLALALTPVPGAGGSFGDYLLTAGDTSTRSSSTRVELWQQSIDLIPENAVVGAGPGLIDTLGPGAGTDRPFYAHNIFLDSAVELGIIGALALLSAFLAAMRIALRERATLALALISAYVVAGLFDDVTYFPRNGFLLAAAFALLLGGAYGASRASGAAGREPPQHLAAEARGSAPPR